MLPGSPFNDSVQTMVHRPVIASDSWRIPVVRIFRERLHVLIALSNTYRASAGNSGTVTVHSCQASSSLAAHLSEARRRTDGRPTAVCSLACLGITSVFCGTGTTSNLSNIISTTTYTRSTYTVTTSTTDGRV